MTIPDSPPENEKDSKSTEWATRYCGFISYSHTQYKLAAWLHQQLEIFQMPKSLIGRETSQGLVPQRLGRFYRDEAEEGAAADLGERIEHALAGSGALIVLCSPASCQSKWVNKEIVRFKQLGRTHRIFLVIVEGELYSGDPATECFPPALKGANDPNGEKPADWIEPLAVDVRKFGRDDALLRLVSGLLGLGYDELKQRELLRAKQRARRSAAIAVSGVALAAVAIGAAIVATNQRSQALRSLADSRSSELAARARAIEVENPELAIALAVKSRRALDAYGVRSPEGEAALRSAMALTRGRVTYCMPSLQGGTIDQTKSFDLTPDNSLLAVGIWGSTVCLYRNGSDGRLDLIDALQSYRGPVDEVRFSSDGKWLISVAGGHYPRALNIANTVLEPGKKKFTDTHYGFFLFGGHDAADAISFDSRTTRIAFVPEGKSSIEVWALANLDPEKIPERSLEVKGKVVATGFSHDGRYLAALIDEGPARSSADVLRGERSNIRLRAQVWDMQSSEAWEIKSVLSRIERLWIEDGIAGERLRGQIAVGPGGRWIAPALQLSDQHRSARQLGAEVWVVPKGAPARPLRVFNGAYEDNGEDWARVTSLDFSPDGRWLYAAHERELRLWHVDERAITQPATVLLASPYARAGTRKALGVIYDAAVSPDSRSIAASHSNGVLSVWGLQSPGSGKEWSSFSVERPNEMFGSSERLRFSADSRFVIAGGSSGAALICSVDDACGPLEPRRVPAPSNEVQWRSWRAGPNDAWLAGVSEVNRVHFWRPSELGRAFFVADLSQAGSNEPVTAREYAIVSGTPGTPVAIISSEDGAWAAAYKVDQYGFHKALYLLRLDSAPAQYEVRIAGLGCAKDTEESFYSVRIDGHAKRLFLANKWGCAASVSLPGPDAKPNSKLVPVREENFNGSAVGFSERYIIAGPAWLSGDSTLWTRNKDGTPREAIYSVSGGTILLAPRDTWIIAAGKKAAATKAPPDTHVVEVAQANVVGTLSKWAQLAIFRSKVALVMSPNNKWLVAVGEKEGAEGKEVVLWRSGQFDTPRGRWQVSFAAAPVVVFSPKSDRLIVAPEAYPSRYGTLPPRSVNALLIDLRNEKVTAEALDVPIGDFNSGCTSGDFSCDEMEYSFSVDGSLLASSNPGNLWNISGSPARYLSFLKGDYPVFSGSGPWMATVGARGTEVWSVAGGRIESRGIWPSSGSIHFLAGGDRLLGLSNGTLFDRTLTADSLLDRAAAQIGRNLTIEEWRSEFQDESYEVTFANLPIHTTYINELISRAQLSARDGRIDEARELFAHAAEEAVKSRSVNACEVVVEKAIRAGQAQSALAAADFHVQALARSAQALQSRGAARAMAGHINEAIEDFRNANLQQSDEESKTRRERWIERLRRGESVAAEEFYE